MDINYRWYKFIELSSHELYAVLRLRQQVFIVEQNCPYLDCDNLDLKAYHLIGWLRTNKNLKPVTYLRLLPPGAQNHSTSHAPLIPGSTDQMVAIGRILTHLEIRNKQIGSKIVKLALQKCETHFPGSKVRLSAQKHLVAFYEAIGFKITSEEYLEDGIPHIEMIRN